MVKMNNIKIHNSAYKLLKEITVINNRSLVKTIDMLVNQEYRRLKKNDYAKKKRTETTISFSK